jgi:phenylacetate-CoA ligase
MRVYRQMIEKFQPSYIRGMASSLFLFSRFLVAEGLELDQGRPRAVFSSCEQLYDWEKEMIERGLRAPVANTYGVSEHSEIAACPPCGSMHLMEEDVYCELVPLSEDGQTLEIVATQLNNTLTPLIRYRTGDIADRITQGCSCGRGLAILEGLRGRAHDFIVAPDGRFVHGQFFTHLLVFESGIQKYQVIQEELTRFRILLVTGPDYSRESETRVLTGMQSYLGDSIKVQFEYPDNIPLTGAGKHRWIVSKVAQRAAENPASQLAPG